MSSRELTPIEDAYLKKRELCNIHVTFFDWFKVQTLLIRDISAQRSEENETY